VARFPPELRRYRLVVVASSLFLAGAGGIALHAAFSPDPVGSSPIPFVLFAAVAFSVSGFALFFVPRWYRRAVHLVSTTAPLPGRATLTLEEDSESTSLFATVSTPEAPDGPMDRIALLMPRWAFRPFLGRPLVVGLHVDPSSSRLMAISTEHGLLWCMPMGCVVRPLA